MVSQWAHALVGRWHTLSEGEKQIYDEMAVVFGPRRAQEVPRAASHHHTLTWDDAYRLESQIALLLGGERLRQEIAARLRVAATEHVREACALQTYYADLTKSLDGQDAEKTNGVLRDFLREVLEAVHWHSKRKYLARQVRLEATRNTLVVSLVVLGLVLGPYLLLAVGEAPNKANQASAFLDVFGSTRALFNGDWIWAHFGLYTALTCGLLGALFSRLSTLQTHWSIMAVDELYNARAFHYILLRASIGMCGALIVYFFLQSGLVQGKVFPEFQKLQLGEGTTAVFQKSAKLMLPSADLALLIVWSFIAGFSESLVPSVLSNTERQLGGAINGKPA
jgi:hypothetical protein